MLSKMMIQLLPQQYMLKTRSALNCRVLILLLALSLECFLATGFAVNEHNWYTPSHRHHGDYQSLGATKNDQETWSRSSEGFSSPFGLRKRVKAVLQKAKDRTGVTNFNTETTSPGSVVAETASIGGFDINDADLDFESPLSTPQTSSYWLPQNNTYDGGGLILPSVERDERSSSSTVDALLNTEQTLEPLPFTLPTLTQEQEQLLRSGQRVQEQSKMGREGSGYVVMDVKAPSRVVWECLLDFEAYPENIGTVKRMTMFTNTHLKSSYIAESPLPSGTGREKRHHGTPSITRASFVLSKFHLNIAAIHKYLPHPDGHYMVFTLDRACKNLVMKDAKGIWYTQSLPPASSSSSSTDVVETTRVWLLCEVKVSSLLPSFIVDYAAKRAMPRATTWLPLLAERVAKEEQQQQKSSSLVMPSSINRVNGGA